MLRRFSNLTKINHDKCESCSLLVRCLARGPVTIRACKTCDKIYTGEKIPNRSKTRTTDLREETHAPVPTPPCYVELVETEETPWECFACRIKRMTKISLEQREARGAQYISEPHKIYLLGEREPVLVRDVIKEMTNPKRVSKK